MSVYECLGTITSVVSTLMFLSALLFLDRKEDLFVKFHR